MGFPGVSVVKNLPAMQETVLMSGLGRSLGEGNGNLLQYSCLENSMDRGAWQTTVWGRNRVGLSVVTKQQLRICIYYLLCAQSLSRVRFVAYPRTGAHQAPLPKKFSQQKYWSRSPCPPPGDLPNPGVEPTSPASPALASRFLTTDPPGKPIFPLKSSLGWDIYK